MIPILVSFVFHAVLFLFLYVAAGMWLLAQPKAIRFVAQNNMDSDNWHLLRTIALWPCVLYLAYFKEDD